MDEFLKGIGKLVGGLALLLYSAFASGLVFFKFYNWFVLPVFDLPIISYLSAVGLSVFLILFKNLQTDEDTSTEAYIKAIILPWMLLFMGWFVALFI